MTLPKVTLVVSPRERFSYTQQNLESLYENTRYPFSLVYVDGNSPAPVRRYLEVEARERGFTVVRTDRYLAPNQARNLGLTQVGTDSEYVVFVDNDVSVAPGWLEKLVTCAQEEAATVVCPLTCIGKNLHQKIHLAGGEARIVLEVNGDTMKRKVHEKHYFVNRPVAEVQDKLHRQQCEFAEFHCLLVRQSIFDEIGLLDEELLNTREHIDFCLSITQAGGKIFCEPDSVVTYVPDSGFEWSDLTFFMLRWSDEWEEKSLKHFRTKWDLTKKDKYFQKRYRRLGYRRHNAFLKPLVRRISFGQTTPWLEKLIIRAERPLNRYITHRHQVLVAQK